MKIALLESLGIPEEDLRRLETPFAAEGHTFAHYPRTADIETLTREAADAEVLMLANMPLPAAVLDNCPRLRYVDIAFTGVDHVAVDALKRRRIPVSNASGYSTEAVAELAVGTAISLLRDLRRAEDSCRAGGTKAGLNAKELRGKTVGIVGLGKIGRRSAELFHAFGCRVLSVSRGRHADAPEWVTETDLTEVLRASDIVALHCPLNDATRGLIGAAELAQMKPSAFLLNLARGPVVQSAALCEALEAGQIAGAALDVFDVEPPLPEDLPLLRAPHVLPTPHLGFATEESMALRAEIVFGNLRAWLDGAPVNLV